MCVSTHSSLCLSCRRTIINHLDPFPNFNSTLRKLKRYPNEKKGVCHPSFVVVTSYKIRNFSTTNPVSTI